MHHQHLLEHLAQIEAHAAAGLRDIARQREVIDELVYEGRDPRNAIERLELIEKSHATRIADVRRVRAELAAEV